MVGDWYTNCVLTFYIVLLHMRKDELTIIN